MSTLRQTVAIDLSASLSSAFSEFMGYRMRRIQAAQGLSLGDFRDLHQDLIRRATEVGGTASTGEALHEALERHLFVQHGYEYPALDPQSLAELHIEAAGDSGGVCPSVTHFIGERVSCCRMTRNRGYPPTCHPFYHVLLKCNLTHCW